MAPCVRCQERHIGCKRPPTAWDVKPGLKRRCEACEKANEECRDLPKDNFKAWSPTDYSKKHKVRYVPLGPHVAWDAINKEVDEDIKPQYDHGETAYVQVASPPFSPVVDSSSTSTVASASPPIVSQQSSPPFGTRPGNEFVPTINSLLNTDPRDRSRGSVSEPNWTTTSSRRDSTLPHPQVSHGQVQPPIDYLSSQLSNSADKEQEAKMLIRHYMDNVALFFDMCDTQKHFMYYVPKLAEEDRILENAILALSARHLSNTKPPPDFPQHIAYEYYGKYLSLMGRLKAVNPESFLATSIILRLYEEMSTYIDGKADMHLLTSRALVTIFTNQPSFSQYALRGTPSQQALYFAAYRQELFNSLMEKKSFRTDIFPRQVSFEIADETTWAHRSIALVGAVIHFAFDEEKASDHAYQVRTFTGLWEECEEWRRKKPSHFKSAYKQKDAYGRHYSWIPFRQYAHVIGRQYNRLSRILLRIHDPRIPWLGLHNIEERCRNEENVRKDVRRLVAVAKSNSDCFPAKFVACFAISLVGCLFTGREDRRACFEMLRDVDESHGFPMTDSLRHFQEIWREDLET